MHREKMVLLQSWELEGKVVYGDWESKKDQFGHGTSIAPSGDPEFLGVKKEDVVRY